MLSLEYERDLVTKEFQVDCESVHVVELAATTLRVTRRLKNPFASDTLSEPDAL